MTRWIRFLAAAASIAAVATFFESPAPSGAGEQTTPIPLLPQVTPPVAAPTLEPAPTPVNPDPENPTGRLIEISIKTQRLTAWRNGKIVHRFVISTGRQGYETPPGRYRILEKYENRWSRKWSVWMPYAMRWYQGYFIHQLPHKDGSSYNIGAAKLGPPTATDASASTWEMPRRCSAGRRSGHRSGSTSKPPSTPAGLPLPRASPFLERTHHRHEWELGR